MLTPVLRAMKRRLHRWELEHLRQHAADLFERLEAAERRAADAEERASAAESACDFWHDQAVHMHRGAAEQTGGARGLTMDGRLVIVSAPTAGGLFA